MALSEQDKKEIEQMIEKRVPSIIEKLFSRSLRQIREFFISNIN